MPKVRVSDIEMHYQEAGEGDPLLVTGGWGLGPRWLEGPQREEFTKRYRCIVHDHRGMGGTDAPDAPYTTETMGDDLNGLLERLDLDRVRVLGQGGMGGIVALQLAINHPDKVRSLSVGAGCARVDPFLREVMHVWKELRRQDPVLWAREVYLWCVTPEYYNAHPESTQAAVANRIDYNPFLQPWAYDHTVDAYVSHDVTDRLHLVKCPTLVTCGGWEDFITGPRYAREVAARIPGAKLHIFENTSHNYGSQFREEYDRLILDWFERT